MVAAKQHALPTDLKSLTEQLGEPFAKALAAFVKEASGKNEKGVLDQLRASEPLNKAVEEHAEELLEENRRLAKEERLKTTKFSDIPRPRPTLRALAKSSGITQKELAKKTDMDPAVVSRVLNNPGRSKLSTVKRVANALGAGLGDLNLDDEPVRPKRTATSASRR